MISFSLRDKIEGAFFGVPIGDALGMSVETYTKAKIGEKFPKGVDKYYPILASDNHPFFPEKIAGEWTDDWLFSDSLMRSLIACGFINMDDISKRDLALYDAGLKPYGCGSTILDALRALKKGIHWSLSGVEVAFKKGGGNGVAMKVTPIACYLLGRYLREKTLGETLEWVIPEEEKQAIANLARMTHKTSVGIASGFAHIYAIIYCLKATPETFNQDDFFNFILKGCRIGEDLLVDSLSEQLYDKIKFVSKLNISSLTDDEIIQTFDDSPFFVVYSLPFTYVFFVKNLKSGKPPFNVPNMGGDTDTNGSMAFSMWGALYGKKYFPQYLIDGLWRKDEIGEGVNGFCGRFDIN